MYQGMVYSSLERSANYPLMQRMNIRRVPLGLFALGTVKFLHTMLCLYVHCPLLVVIVNMYFLVSC